jgi:hypothetical protein
MRFCADFDAACAMITFDFSLEAKTRLKVWPDHCDICFDRVPVTHIPCFNKDTKRAWTDKMCAKCAVAYATDDAFTLFADDMFGTVEFDAVEADL